MRKIIFGFWAVLIVVIYFGSFIHGTSSDINSHASKKNSKPIKVNYYTSNN